MARAFIALTKPEAKMVLALVLEHLEENAWKSSLLDHITYELAYALFGEDGVHIQGADRTLLRNEALKEWRFERDGS